MPIDDCPHSFAEIATDLLPACMARMREAINSPINMAEWATKGVGLQTILRNLDRTADFSGCYVFLEDTTPIYVGISRTVIQRILTHLKGTDYYTATLSYQMAKDEHPHGLTANEAMEDAPFMELFKSKIAFLGSLHLAFIEIDDPVTLYLFEVYCAMELDTCRWNAFKTH